MRIQVKESLGGIQLLSLHLRKRRRGVHQYVNLCEPGGSGRAHVSANVCLYFIQGFKKRKEYKNKLELCLKVEKDQEQYEKTQYKILGKSCFAAEI